MRRVGKLTAVLACVWAGSLTLALPTSDLLDGSTVLAKGNGGGSDHDAALDAQLAQVLRDAGFSGRIESTLEQRLGRRIDHKLAELGRMLWFDTAHSLHQDNTCGGCHSPTNGFGDSQPMAIGVDSNGKVGPNRSGPRNQRRSPLVINNAFYPKLMWNGRFSAVSGDPFDNSGGFLFPDPEALVRFPPGGDLDVRGLTHLLQAQAHIPPTETVEVAGFNGICAQEGPSPGNPFCQFDHSAVVVGPNLAHGQDLPSPDGSGFRNEPIRQSGLDTLNAIPKYRKLFGLIFPSVNAGGPIDFDMFGLAIAEFEIAEMTFADAPLDRFARGHKNAMTASQKRGALLFFGAAGCVQCHAVAGPSNEMFSDFVNRNIAVPQVFPFFGAGTNNFPFDGDDLQEDFGQEQISGEEADRYHFRTAPLRNLKLAPAYFHNGSFTTLEGAIQHHLNVSASVNGYNPVAEGVPGDLQQVGPTTPLLTLDPLLQTPINLTSDEFDDLVEFVREGLYDDGADPQKLCKLVPAVVPSGMAVLEFEACDALSKGHKGKKGRP